MKATLAVFCLFLANALAAPTSNEDIVIINNDFFLDDFIVYTAEHDIVSVIVPLNALNFEEDSEETDNTDSNVIKFFVEADVKDGVKDYKGLYILKGDKATKLLDDGTDAAAVNDETKTVYFSAKDGIYVYNAEKNKAEKYGTVTDSLIGIVKENGTNVLYVLTEDHILYKVTEDGTKKEAIDEVQNAQEIVLDYNNNLYFYGTDKKLYVMTSYGVKEIIGLPENPSSVKLIRPPFIIEDGIPVLVDNSMYVIYANGSSEYTDIEVKTQPTAYSVEATLLQYFAHNKRIYEYNILAIVLGNTLEEIKRFLDDKKNDIQSIATRSRSSLRA